LPFDVEESADEPVAVARVCGRLLDDRVGTLGALRMGVMSYLCAGRSFLYARGECEEVI